MMEAWAHRGTMSRAEGLASELSLIEPPACEALEGGLTHTRRGGLSFEPRRIWVPSPDTAIPVAEPWAAMLSVTATCDTPQVAIPTLQPPSSWCATCRCASCWRPAPAVGIGSVRTSSELSPGDAVLPRAAATVAEALRPLVVAAAEAAVVLAWPTCAEAATELRTMHAAAEGIVEADGPRCLGTKSMRPAAALDALDASPPKGGGSTAAADAASEAAAAAEAAAEAAVKHEAGKSRFAESSEHRMRSVSAPLDMHALDRMHACGAY